MYGHACDYCEGGEVRCEVQARELIRITRLDTVALEQVPVGVCDRCKARYYHASVLEQAEALRRKPTRRVLRIPVSRFVGGRPLKV